MPDLNVLFDTSCHRSSLGYVPVFIDATDIEMDKNLTVRCVAIAAYTGYQMHSVFVGILMNDGEFAV